MISFIWLSLAQLAVAQEKLIAGKIIDSSDGSALANVSVMAKGTQIGTKTDNKGEFKMSVPLTIQILTISAAEYNSKEINVGKSNYIEVMLTNNSRALNDVVVIGYGTVKKKDLTGSISRVSAANFNKGIFTIKNLSLFSTITDLREISSYLF